MDYRRISRELMRALRGSRSQEYVNRRLGVSYNLSYRWESGKKRILWRDFDKICQALKVNLASVLNTTFGKRRHWDGRAVVNELTGQTPVTGISREIGVSRYVISDWKNGVSSPPLEKIMALFDRQWLLHAFLETLTDPSKLPSLRAGDKLHLLEKQLYFKNPQLLAASLCFELEQYKRLKTHQSGFVAGLLGLSQAEEDQILQILVKTKKLEFRNGKYQISPRHVYIRGTDEFEERIRKHWLTQASRAAIQGQWQPEEGVSRYRVMSVSDKALGEILELATHFFRQIDAIVANDKKPTCLKILSLNITDLSAPGSP